MLETFYSNNPKYVFHVKIADYNDIKTLLNSTNDIIILPKKSYYNHNYNKPVFVFDIQKCYDEDYNNFDNIVIAILNYEYTKLNTLHTNKKSQMLHLGIYDVLNNHENTLNMMILFCCANNKLNLLHIIKNNPLFPKLPVSCFALYFLIAIIFGDILIIEFIAKFIKKEIAVAQITRYMVNDCYKICKIDKNVMLYTISHLSLLTGGNNKNISVLYPHILKSLTKVPVILPTLNNSLVLLPYCFDLHKITVIKYAFCKILVFDIYINEILFFYFMIA